MADFHGEQVKQYLRFFRAKREVQLQEINAIVADCKEDRFGDAGDIFNRDEILEVLDELCVHIQNCVRTDLQRTVSMGVLAIRQLFEEAEAHGIELEVDTALIEDKSLIEEVENMALDGPSKALRSKTNRLKSIGREHDELAQKVAQLEEEAARRDGDVKTLKERASALQLENASLVAGEAALRREADRLREMLRQQGGAAGGGGGGAEQKAAEGKGADASGQRGPPSGNAMRSARERLKSGSISQEEFDAVAAQHGTKDARGYQRRLRDLQDQHEQLQAELADAKDLLRSEKGIDIDSFKKSRQFVQMRKLMATKTRQVKDLRARLDRYEPDIVPEDEDPNAAVDYKHK